MGIEIDLLKVGDASKSGDAITVRFGKLDGNRDEQTVLVIDTGFAATGTEIVDHVKKHYGTDYIDLLVCTHPDLDHAGGLETVIQDLTPKEIWMHLPWEHSADIRNLFHDGRITDASLDRRVREAYDHIHDAYALSLELEIPVTEPFSDGAEVLPHRENGLYVLGPTKAAYQALLPDFRGTPKAKEKARLQALTDSVRAFFASASAAVSKAFENWGIETLKDPGSSATAAENNSSAILLLIVDDKQYLFAGDAGVEGLQTALDCASDLGIDLKDSVFLKVPHHGSKHNVGPTVLNQLIGEPLPNQPTNHKMTCVITSTAGDEGHPAQKVVNALLRRGAFVTSTEDGNKLHHAGCPMRQGWSPIGTMVLHSEVEDD